MIITEIKSTGNRADIARVEIYRTLSPQKRIEKVIANRLCKFKFFNQALLFCLVAAVFSLFYPSYSFAYNLKSKADSVKELNAEHKTSHDKTQESITQEKYPKQIL